MQIDESVPALSSDLINLVADYDTPLAMQPLRVDDMGNLIRSRESSETRSAIHEALISRDTDPVIKRQIFINAMEFGYQLQLNRLFMELRNLKQTINLDNTDLSNLVLKAMELSHASGLNINLSGSIIEDCSFFRADLTNANLKGTTFRNVELSRTILHRAKFDQTRWIRCAAMDLITNDTELQTFAYLVRFEVYLNGIHTTQLSRLQVAAMRLTAPVLPLVRHCVIS